VYHYWFIIAGTSSQHQQFIVGRASVLEVVHIAISQASEKIPKVVSCDSLESSPRASRKMDDHDLVLKPMGMGQNSVPQQLDG